MEGSCLAPGSTPRCGEEHGERSERLCHLPEALCEAGTLVDRTAPCCEPEIHIWIFVCLWMVLQRRL